MCGRFVRESTLQEIADAFGAGMPSFDLLPSYNIAPSHEIPVIIHSGENHIEICRWGFVPPWSKDPGIGVKLINARSESVADKPSFRKSFRSHRILIPATGFFEWKKQNNRKIPYFISLKSKKPFGFAGLCSRWAAPRQKQICTCTIITTEANELLKPIHKRMPVIIEKQNEKAWLDPSEHDSNRLLRFLKPYASDEMVCYEVSTLVNSPAHNAPVCIKPFKTGASPIDKDDIHDG